MVQLDNVTHSDGAEEEEVYMSGTRAEADSAEAWIESTSNYCVEAERTIVALPGSPWSSSSEV